ncbi:glycosyltransferase [Candidatus Pelagibacter ubique]|nr:glycosyltransferase [Candidatus Pelagibacter ubique]
MNKEKISILITNFNKEKFIEECILSCLSQNYNNLEIIIVDNSSTDKSMSKIKKYSNELFAIKKKRDSLYSPKNQIDSLIEAFKKSTGNIILLLDGDDYFLPNKASHIKGIFLKNNNLDVVFDVPRILSNNKFTRLKIKKKYNKNIWPTTIPTSGISFKRAFFENCLEFNLFDSYPTLEIDFRLNFFAQRIQRKFLIIKENLTIYRKVNDGIMSNVNFFSYNWWKKRLQAHYFIFDIYKENKIEYKKNYDFYLTIIIVWLLNKIIK